MKNLPLGIQSFQRLRKGDYVYVDKTELIYDLVQSQDGFYFLSRPRRFGKSLLVSTLATLFEGKKEFFEGLWIHENSDYIWEKHPVVLLDFNGIDDKNPDELQQSLLEKLDLIAEQHDITLPSNLIGGKFSRLITGLAKKYEKDVVVLVDEYDKTIVNHLGKGKEEEEIALQNRDILKRLFGVLKNSDVAAVLRFVFLTGVSKFSRVSVFSDLNNLEDLTIDESYCDLTGYTEEELHSCFPEHIKALAKAEATDTEACKEKLRRWYNGYQFTRKNKTLYNPFSILSVLKKKVFRNYWFETGTPTFLLNLIQEQNYPIPKIEKMEMVESSLSTFDVNQLRLEALLFQTGYITIKEYEEEIYHLSYPNQEVKTSFLTFLYGYLLGGSQTEERDKFAHLQRHLRNADYEAFVDTINTILASVPYSQIANKDEPWFHSLFYIMLSASGVDVLTEILTSKGRIDIAVFTDNTIHIIELKCDQTADEAIQQIKDKDYAKRYQNHSKQIILMGINFDSKKRAITDWKYEQL